MSETTDQRAFARLVTLLVSTEIGTHSDGDAITLTEGPARNLAAALIQWGYRDVTDATATSVRQRAEDVLADHTMGPDAIWCGGEDPSPTCRWEPDWQIVDQIDATRQFARHQADMLSALLAMKETEHDVLSRLTGDRGRRYATELGGSR